MIATDTPARTHPIWLVRHARSAWTERRWCGRADPMLTATGRQEARDLALRLAAELPAGTLVMTSPLRRAVATAAAIASVANLTVVLDPDLVEVDVGRVEGLTWTEVQRREPETAAAILGGREVDWPDGESTRAVRARASRVAAALEQLRAASPIVVVSHGAFLHAVAAAFASGRESEVLRPAGLLRFDR